MIDNLSRLPFDQIYGDIESRHWELVQKLKLLGQDEMKITNMIIPWLVQDKQPDIAQIFKSLEDGKFE